MGQYDRWAEKNFGTPDIGQKPDSFEPIPVKREKKKKKSLYGKKAGWLRTGWAAPDPIKEDRVRKVESATGGKLPTSLTRTFASSGWSDEDLAKATRLIRSNIDVPTSFFIKQSGFKRQGDMFFNRNTEQSVTVAEAKRVFGTGGNDVKYLKYFLSDLTVPTKDGGTTKVNPLYAASLLRITQTVDGWNKMPWKNQLAMVRSAAAAGIANPKGIESFGKNWNSINEALPTLEYMDRFRVALAASSSGRTFSGPEGVSELLMIAGAVTKGKVGVNPGEGGSAPSDRVAAALIGTFKERLSPIIQGLVANPHYFDSAESLDTAEQAIKPYVDNIFGIAERTARKEADALGFNFVDENDKYVSTEEMYAFLESKGKTKQSYYMIAALQVLPGAIVGQEKGAVLSVEDNAISGKYAKAAAEAWSKMLPGNDVDKNLLEAYDAISRLTAYSDVNIAQYQRMAAEFDAGPVGWIGDAVWSIPQGLGRTWAGGFKTAAKVLTDPIAYTQKLIKDPIKAANEIAKGRSLGFDPKRDEAGNAFVDAFEFVTKPLVQLDNMMLAGMNKVMSAWEEGWYKIGVDHARLINGADFDETAWIETEAELAEIESYNQETTARIWENDSNELSVIGDRWWDKYQDKQGVQRASGIDDWLLDMMGSVGYAAEVLEATAMDPLTLAAKPASKFAKVRVLANLSEGVHGGIDEILQGKILGGLIARRHGINTAVDADGLFIHGAPGLQLINHFLGKPKNMYVAGKGWTKMSPVEFVVDNFRRHATDKVARRNHFNMFRGNMGGAVLESWWKQLDFEIEALEGLRKIGLMDEAYITAHVRNRLAMALHDPQAAMDLGDDLTQVMVEASKLKSKASAVAKIQKKLDAAQAAHKMDDVKSYTHGLKTSQGKLDAEITRLAEARGLNPARAIAHVNELDDPAEEFKLMEDIFGAGRQMAGGNKLKDAQAGLTYAVGGAGFKGYLPNLGGPMFYAQQLFKAGVNAKYMPTKYVQGLGRNLASSLGGFSGSVHDMHKTIKAVSAAMNRARAGGKQVWSEAEIMAKTDELYRISSNPRAERDLRKFFFKLDHETTLRLAKGLKMEVTEIDGKLADEVLQYAIDTHRREFHRRQAGSYGLSDSDQKAYIDAIERGEYDEAMDVVDNHISTLDNDNAAILTTQFVNEIPFMNPVKTKEMLEESLGFVNMMANKMRTIIGVDDYAKINPDQILSGKANLVKWWHKGVRDGLLGTFNQTWKMSQVVSVRYILKVAGIDENIRFLAIEGPMARMAANKWVDRRMMQTEDGVRQAAGNLPFGYLPVYASEPNHVFTLDVSNSPEFLQSLKRAGYSSGQSGVEEVIVDARIAGAHSGTFDMPGLERWNLLGEKERQQLMDSIKQPEGTEWIEDSLAAKIFGGENARAMGMYHPNDGVIYLNTDVLRDSWKQPIAAHQEIVGNARRRLLPSWMHDEALQRPASKASRPSKEVSAYTDTVNHEVGHAISTLTGRQVDWLKKSILLPTKNRVAYASRYIKNASLDANPFNNGAYLRKTTPSRGVNTIQSVPTLGGQSIDMPVYVIDTIAAWKSWYLGAAKGDGELKSIRDITRVNQLSSTDAANKIDEIWAELYALWKADPDYMKKVMPEVHAQMYRYRNIMLHAEAGAKKNVRFMELAPTMPSLNGRRLSPDDVSVDPHELVNNIPNIGPDDVATEGLVHTGSVSSNFGRVNESIARGMESKYGRTTNATPSGTKSWSEVISEFKGGPGKGSKAVKDFINVWSVLAHDHIRRDKLGQIALDALANEHGIAGATSAVEEFLRKDGGAYWGKRYFVPKKRYEAKSVQVATLASKYTLDDPMVARVLLSMNDHNDFADYLYRVVGTPGAKRKRIDIPGREDLGPAASRDDILSSEVIKTAEGKRLNGDIMDPNFTIGWPEIESNFYGRIEKFTATIGRWVFENPTNVLNRQPFFRHNFLRTRNAMLDMAKARGINVTDDMLEQFEGVARIEAIEKTKAVMFDFQNQSQFGELARFVIPFFQPAAEAFVVYSRIARTNPAFVARVGSMLRLSEKMGVIKEDGETGEKYVDVDMLGIGGALNVLQNLPVLNPMKNAQEFLGVVGFSKYDNRMALDSFNFLMSNTIPIRIGGEDADGRPNVIPVPFPGLTPGAMMILQGIADDPDVPLWLKQPLTEFAYQHGATTIKSFLPGPIRTVVDSFGSESEGNYKASIAIQFGKTWALQGITPRTIASDPDLAKAAGFTLPTDTAWGSREAIMAAEKFLAEKANSAATGLLQVRGFTQLMLPSTVQRVFPTEELDNMWKETLRESEGDIEKAIEEFTTLHSDVPNIEYLTMSASLWEGGHKLTFGDRGLSMPASPEADKFLAQPRFKEFMLKYPELAPSILPPEVWAADFNRSYYLQQVNQGMRGTLTAEEWYADVDVNKGYELYNSIKATYEGDLARLEGIGITSPYNTAVMAAKARYDKAVKYTKDMYPNWGEVHGGSAGDRDEESRQTISHLQNALTIEAFANTNTGQALKQYMDIRETIRTAMYRSNIGTTKSTFFAELELPSGEKAGVALERARALVDESPGFERIYNYYLQHDLENVFKHSSDVLENLTPEQHKAMVDYNKRYQELTLETQLVDRSGDAAPTYYARRKLENDAIAQYGMNSRMNPVHVWWETAAPLARLQRKDRAATSPASYWSNFDWQKFAGIKPSKTASSLMDQIGSIYAQASAAKAADPNADVKGYYADVDDIVAMGLQTDHSFSRMYDVMGTWGGSFFSVTKLDQLNGDEGDAWRSIQSALQQSQLEMDNQDLHGLGSFDDAENDKWYQMQENILNLRDMWAAKSPMFKERWEQYEKDNPEFLSVLIPETYYRLGGKQVLKPPAGFTSDVIGAVPDSGLLKGVKDAPATILNVTDADTLTVRLSKAIPGYDKGDEVSIRVGGIRAPEAETEEGRRATKYIQGLFTSGANVSISFAGQDSVGRPIAQVTLPDGTSWATYIVSGGYAIASNQYSNSRKVEKDIQQAQGEALWDEDKYGYGKGGS